MKDNIEVNSISTDSINGEKPEISGLKCVGCGEVGHTIPVWEDIREYFDGADPDYIGCTNCHNMYSMTEDISDEHYYE